jgi:monovalent cation:H+ antiporter, CPA1 family
MSLFTAAAILITLTALLAWVNERTLKLPPAIGIMLGALLASVLVLVAEGLGLHAEEGVRLLLAEVEFDELLMQGMLSFLLFAGALHVDLSDLLREKWTVLSLATIGVVVSTFLVGTAFWWILGWLGVAIPYPWALVFGALISPTDPIAVLALLKQARAPQRLQSLITGESLFNDGVGVVVFTAVVGLAVAGEASPGAIGALFLEEAVGGAIFGLGLGYVGFHLLRWVDNASVEVLLTLALVQGGYALAGALHTSGPIAMVIAGLFIGNRGRLFAMSESTREHLDTFWELLDEILNAVLFLLIGLEVLVVRFSPNLLAMGLVVIPMVLFARFLAVGGTIRLLALTDEFPPYTVRIMTWGGLRGGISVALALSLPPGETRDLVVFATYVVVVFSIVVQGLTLGKLAGRGRAAAEDLERRRAERAVVREG